MKPEENGKTGGVENSVTEEWPRISSRFQLVILACQRSKQLLRGAKPRIVVDRKTRRNTSIALEELRRGLIPFDCLKQPQDFHLVGSWSIAPKHLEDPQLR
jgi:DNA-directed RNA polymerase omega subunit